MLRSSLLLVLLAATLALGLRDSHAKPTGQNSSKLQQLNTSRHKYALDGTKSPRANVSIISALLGSPRMMPTGRAERTLGASSARALSTAQHTAVLQTSASVRHTCSVLGDGRALCFGDGANGRLGTDSTVTRGDGGAHSAASGIVVLPPDTKVVMVMTGWYSTLFLLSDGRLICVGNGRLCNGGGADRGDAPVRTTAASFPSVRGNEMVWRADNGNEHICTILVNDELACWGVGTDGRLGTGSTADVAVGFGTAAVVALPAGKTAMDVSCGHKHTCVLLSSGELMCFGSAASGQIGSNTAVDIGDGSGPAAELGIVDLPSGTTAVQLSAGADHTCAVLSDARVLCFGNGGNGRLGSGASTNIGGGGDPAAETGIVALPGGAEAVYVTSGHFHTCVILADARLTCYGKGTTGQLGSNSTADILLATHGIVDLPPGSQVVQVSAGESHTCAVITTGDLFCFGSGANGRTGQDSTSNVGDDAARPVGGSKVALPPLDIVLDIAVNGGAACMLTASANVACWGHNIFGALGTGLPNIYVGRDDLTSSGIFTDLNFTTHKVEAVGAHACAISSAGKLNCWGSGSNGRLGRGNSVNIGKDESAATAGSLEERPGYVVIDVALLSQSTCALFQSTSDCRSRPLVCWGRNTEGQLGRGDADGTARFDTPATAPEVEMHAGKIVQQLAAEHTFICALYYDGTLTCWGSGGDGQLGLGDTINRGLHETPGSLPLVSLPTGRHAVQVTSGVLHVCVLLDDGTVRCWGKNNHGQLGYGNTDNQGDHPSRTPDTLPPVSLPGNLRVVHLASGSNQNCVVLVDGSVCCWGFNLQGQLGNGNAETVGDDETPADVGTIPMPHGARAVSTHLANAYTCALLTTGSPVCWGILPHMPTGSTPTTRPAVDFLYTWPTFAPAADVALASAPPVPPPCPPSASPTPAATSSPTSSPTGTSSVSPTQTASVTPSGTTSPTPTASNSATPSVSASFTSSSSRTPSLTPSSSRTPSVSPTASTSPSTTATSSTTGTSTVSPTQSQTATVSPSPTANATMSSSQTPTATTSASQTAVPTTTPTSTQRQGGEAFPSSLPSSKPLVQVSPTRTATGTPTASPSANPTRDPGTSPTATPSGSPAALPKLEAFPRSLQAQVQFGQVVAIRRSLFIQSSATTEWSVATSSLRERTGLDFTFSTSSKSTGTSEQRVELLISGVVTASKSFTVNIAISASHPAGAPRLPGRLNADQLPPSVIPVNVEVLAARMQVGPSPLLVSQIPGTTAVTQLRVANSGSGALSWSVGHAPLAAPAPWLGVRYSTNGRVLCAASSNHTLATMQPCEAVGAVQGVVAPSDAVEVQVYTVSQDPLSSAIRQAALQIVSNSAVDGTVVLPVTMRATLLSVFPRDVTIGVEPGGSQSAVCRIDSLTDDADLIVSARTSVPWLQVVSGLGLQRVALHPKGAAQSLRLRVTHGGASCGANAARAPQQLCLPAGQSSTRTTIALSVVARPVDNSTQVRRDLARYRGELQVPVDVTLAESGAVAFASGIALPPAVISNATLPAHQRIFVGSRSGTEQLWLKSRDAAHRPAAVPSVEVPQLLALTPVSSQRSQQLAAPVLRGSYDTGLNASHAGVSLTKTAIGQQVISSTRRGHLLGRGAANLTHIGHVHVVSPTCDPSSQVLNDDRTACDCAPGFQLASILPQNTSAPNATTADTAEGACVRCAPGSVRSPLVAFDAACVLCGPGFYADAAQAECLPCVERGFKCIGGQLRPDEGTWCPTCAPSEQDLPSNPVLRARLLEGGSRLGLYTQAEDAQASGRRALAVADSSSTLKRVTNASVVQDTASVLECTPAIACLPRADDSGVQCAPGHRGIACGECMDGWTRASSQELCAQCDRGSTALMLTVALWIVNLGSVFLLALKTPKAVSLAEDRKKRKGVAIAGLFRLVSSWAQVYALLLSSRVPPRTALDSVLGVFSATSMGYSAKSSSMQCLLQLNPYEQLNLSLVLPVFAIAVPFIIAAMSNAVLFCLVLLGCCKPEPPRPSKPISKPAKALAAPSAVAVKPLSPGGKRKKAAAAAPTAGLTAAHDIDDSKGAWADPVPRSSTPKHASGSPKRARRVPGSPIGQSPPKRMAWQDDIFGQDWGDDDLEEETVVMVVPTAMPPVPASSSTATPPTKGNAAQPRSAAAVREHHAAPLTKAALQQRLADEQQELEEEPLSRSARCCQRATRMTILLLLLLHFGVVDTCLRVLRLYDVPVLGARLLDSDLRHGDMDVEFEQSQFLAMVGLAVFGVGLPITGAVLLCMYRSPRQLATQSTRGFFGSLYDGYRVGQLRRDGTRERNVWFWELLVVIPRKMLLAMIVALVSQPIAQASLIVMVLTASLVLHVWLQPYSKQLMNSAETAGLASLLAASMAGLMLLDSGTTRDTSDVVQWALLVVLGAFAVCTVLLAGADIVRARGTTAYKLAAMYGRSSPPTAWWLCGAGWCAAYGGGQGAYMCFITLFGFPSERKQDAAAPGALGSPQPFSLPRQASRRRGSLA